MVLNRFHHLHQDVGVHDIHGLQSLHRPHRICISRQSVGQPTISYHDLGTISPEKARQIIRKVLEHNQGNVSKTARILKTFRHTVRRARDGSLEDLSRKPHRRLTAYLRRKFGLVFSENTVKAILRRDQVKKRTRRSTNGQRRHLYDYETLHLFGEFQLDTKHLLDKQALPPEVYHHMKSSGIPRFEWHLMDVATRARFTPTPMS